MIENIKKKINDPNFMTILFYSMAALVIINRIVSLVIVLSGKCVELTSEELNRALFWSAEEYTLSFLLPLAGFAHFCSSKYGANIDNKTQMYFITYGCLAAICFVMIAQWSNEFILFVTGFYKNGEILKIGLAEAPDKFLSALRYASLYLPACAIALTPTSVAALFDNEHPTNKLKALSLMPSKTTKDPAGEFAADVKLCDDLKTGSPVMITEARRMETVLIQGATGTGKTSTLLLPMCASDLNKKYMFKERAKELGFKALTSGAAYINAPYDNETLNKCFTLNFLRPIYGREKDFMEILKPMIKCEDKENKELVFRDLGITVLEPDGNFIDDFRLIADNLGIMVYKIDPLDPESFGINPFINKSPAKVASIISTVLKGMYESENPNSSNAFFGQVTQQALENLAMLLKIMYPRLHDNTIPTLEDMLECLYDYNLVEDMCEEMKNDPVLSERHAILIKYFEKNFYNPPLDINGKPVLGSVGSNRKETEMFLYGATTQLDNLMRNKMVRRILCSRDNNIDLDKVLAEGGCVTVCTRRGELGALLAKPFGMFYILTMQDAVLRRPGDENSRVPHFMYIDEFPDFVNKETETCFTLFRKYRCGMTIAIQNLSQLERTESMKFYKQVVTSNSKTVAVFGDTNREDSEYWSVAFGKHEYWNLKTGWETKPLENVKKEAENPEGTNMNIDFTENIKPFHLSELPFKTVYYRTRTGKGDQIFGKGVTDFIDKKFLKRWKSEEYDFEEYVNYNPDDTTLREPPVVKGIIDYEIETNEILAGQNTEEVQKQIENERAKMLEIESSTEEKKISKIFDEIEVVDDVKIEIDENV